jgi:nickel-dependent lactate racemase
MSLLAAYIVTAMRSTRRQKKMKDLFVRYRHKKTAFDLPRKWKLLTFAAFADRSEKKDVEVLTKLVLKTPVRSASLRDRISPSDAVAILIEDRTRSSPKNSILKALLEELDGARIPRNNISVVVALGTHRELTTPEMEAFYGKDLVRSYPFINHDCYAPDLVPVGNLKTGTVVKINRKVNEATFKIGIGSIFPHPMNGFGGGGKILFPGVADFDSILEHHLKHSFRVGSGLGKVQGNPFYEEVSALARVAGLNFVINSVLDHNDRLYKLVCGDPVEAHLVGVDLCKRIISHRFQKKADLTVISAFPYTEGTQIMKPLAPASEITREGGVVILVADCTVPLPDPYVECCETFRLKHAGRLRDSIFELFDHNCRIMEEGAPEFNMSMAQALLAQHEFKIILVSDSVPRETAERLGFLFAKDLSQAFAMSAEFVTDPEVHVVPSGGVMLPVLEDTDIRTS